MGNLTTIVFEIQNTNCRKKLPDDSPAASQQDFLFNFSFTLRPCVGGG